MSQEHIPFPNEVQHPNELLQEWQKIRAEVLAILSKLDDEEFDKAPPDGSWSAAQVAEHLYLTQLFFARALPAVLRGKFGQDVTQGSLDHKEAFKKVSAPQGIRNPDAVSPTGTLDRQKIEASLTDSMARLEKGLKGVTADQLRARGYEHPLHGVVDLLEYLWVLTLHENSHKIAMQRKWGTAASQ